MVAKALADHHTKKQLSSLFAGLAHEKALPLLCPLTGSFLRSTLNAYSNKVSYFCFCMTRCGLRALYMTGMVLSEVQFTLEGLS